MPAVCEPGLYFIQDDMKSDHGKKLYASILLKGNKGLFRTLFFVDTGSDITLMQEKRALRIFSKKFIDKHAIKDGSKLLSYTSDQIEIKYRLEVTAFFTKTSNSLKISLNIIENLAGVPDIILGSDNMRKFQGTISYEGEPCLTMLSPTKCKLNTYFLTDRELLQSTQTFSLGPRETKTVRLFLPQHTPAVPGDELCSEWATTQSIEALPSKSQVYRDENSDEYYVFILVKNRKNKNIIDSIRIDYYISENEKAIAISKNNLHTLSQLQLWSPCILSQPHDNNSNQIVFKDSPPNLSSPVKNNIYNINTQTSPKKDSAESNNTIDLNYKCPFDPSPDLDPDILIPKGYEIPDNELEAKDIVNLTNYPQSHRKYIEDIFMKSYPNILSKNSMHCGDISKTLGFYKIFLKPNVSLPNHRKIFNLAPAQRQHLADILGFMQKYGIIEKIPIKSRDTRDHVVGAPSFLVPRATPGKPARLVIDYSKVNELILNEQSVIPSINSLLHSLRGHTFFSTLDVANAYNSFSISEDSRHISTFSTALGLFQMKKIPTGLKTSAAAWSKIIDKIINCEIARDTQGNMIFLQDKTVKLLDSPLTGVFTFFDDIIVATKAGETYTDSLDIHFSLVKNICARLSDHNVIIGFEKASLGKTVIQFLGHTITNSYIIPDKRRIQKLLDAKIPHTRKGFRSFLGLANSIRNTLDSDFMKQIYILTPLTGGNTELKITEKHKVAFETLKKYLVSKPLFNNIIDPNANKILFTDASSAADGYYSAVLAQQTSNNADNHFDKSLCLDSPVDQVIYNLKLKYIPIPPISDIHNPSQTQRELNQTRPPFCDYLNQPFFGYSKTDAPQSLFISIQIILAASKCKILTIPEMRKGLISVIKKSELCLNLETFTFLNNKDEYKTFLAKLETDGDIDETYHSVDALARFLHRQIIIISALEEHRNDPLLKFNQKIDDKPSFILGLLRTSEGKLIFRPYKTISNDSYDIRKDSNTFEIICYHTKSLPKTKSSKHIFEHELFSVLSSLNALKSYIGDSMLTLVTDSRPLFLLFNKVIHNSSVKLCRYSVKLHTDYPNLQVLFTKSETNMADFLSKNFNVKEEDVGRIALSRFSVGNLDDLIPDSPLPLSEWKKIVEANPEKLNIADDEGLIRKMETSVEHMDREDCDMRLNVCSLSKAPAFTRQVSTITSLEKHLSYDKLVQHQRSEFGNYIKACLYSKDREIFTDKLCIFLRFGLLYCKFQSGPKILVPNSLIPVLLAYFHLTTGHGGIKRLTLSISNFHFRRKSELIREISSKCLPCQLVNTPTKPNPLGIYPVPQYPFETCFMDLAENLNNVGGFSHLLVVVDPLSDATLIFPLKTKKANEVFNVFMTGMFMQFQIKNIVTDNGACFSSKEQLKKLALLGLNKVKTSSLNPKARGLVERKVGLVKSLLKKYLALEKTYDWGNLPYLIAKIINSSICSKTGVEPYTLMLGHTVAPFGEGIVKVHPLIDSFADSIKERNEALRTKTELIRSQISKDQIKKNEQLNKNRYPKHFREGMIVFVKDRKVIEGNTRPLKSLYSQSPYIVNRVMTSTLSVKRLCDSFQQVFAKDDVKPYQKLIGFFDDLPTEIREIITQNIELKNLSSKQIETLKISSPIDFPGGLDLGNCEEEISEYNFDELEDDFFTSADQIPTPGERPTSPTKAPLVHESVDQTLPPIDKNDKETVEQVPKYRYNLRPRKSIFNFSPKKSSSKRKNVRFS